MDETCSIAGKWDVHRLQHFSRKCKDYLENLDIWNNDIKEGLKAIGFAGVQWWAFVETVMAMYSIKSYEFCKYLSYCQLLKKASVPWRAWQGEVVSRFLLSDMLPGEQLQQEYSLH
jgi:hypothetical protein